MGSGASVTERSRPVNTRVREAAPGPGPPPGSSPAPSSAPRRDPPPGSSPGSPAPGSSVPVPGSSPGSPPPGSSPAPSSAPRRDPPPGSSPGSPAPGSSAPVPGSSAPGSSAPVPGSSPGSSAPVRGYPPGPSAPGPPPGPAPAPGPSGPAPGSGPGPGQTPPPAGPSVGASQASEDEKAEVQSLKSEEERTRGGEEEERRGRVLPPASDGVGQAQDASLDFESFLHDDGTLYSCFNHHGNRVYVDESQNLQPFPEAWLSQGRFLSHWDQNVVPQGSAQPQAPPAVPDDDRAGSVSIRGRGSVMTYMFEERVNTCRFWDPGSGAWLLLPLRWEVEVDFVRARVQRVMSALPGLLDQQEIAAALRQCSYDPEEVVSVFLALFGDVLLQAPPSRDPTHGELNAFRALLERDRVTEELRQELQRKEEEAGHLSWEVRNLTQAVQHLHQRLAEAQADRQAAQEKVRSLQNRRAPAGRPGPSGTAGALRQVSLLSRQLSVSSKQLRSGVLQALAPMRSQLGQLGEAVGKLALLGGQAAGEARQLRALYRREAVERKALYNKLLELQGNIRVFCRCRRSTASSACLETTEEEEEVLLVQKGSRRKFRFDKVYPESSTQEEVFAGTLPLIASCVDGYQVCILAYGQTGSGKTYTMMGTKEQPGVNIRSVRELLRLCAQKETVSYTLKISMLEIYNETLRDLLAQAEDALLDIRAQGKSVSVPGLSQIQVRSEEDILAVMETGEKNRRIASTKMNTQSSRSHLVVALQVEGSDQVSGLASRGTLTLCDLAGSERISRTEAEGQRLVEAAAINRSLTALGQVFSALKCNALHVPFRNSKLTHLLQPCLSGDAKCCVLVNVSPDVADVLETSSTLQFGSSIRQVSLGKAAPTKANRAVQ